MPILRDARRTTIAALALLSFAGAARPAIAQQLAARDAAAAKPASEFVVIVNVDSPLKTVTREQLSQLFLKREKTLPDGRPAMPVDLDGRTNKVRIAFTSVVHRRSLVAVNNYWQQQIFSGREVPPPAMAMERDIVAFVRDNPDAVGYVSPATELGRGIRVLQLVD